MEFYYFLVARGGISFGRACSSCTYSTVLDDIDWYRDAELICPFKGRSSMRVSKTNGAQPCQAIKENSPTSGLFKFLVARGGIEPPTQGFSILCSTDWATRPFKIANYTQLWVGAGGMSLPVLALRECGAILPEVGVWHPVGRCSTWNNRQRYLNPLLYETNEFDSKQK